MHESNVLIGPDGSFTWVMSGQLQPGQPSHKQLLRMYGFPAGQGLHYPSHDTASQFNLAPRMPQQGHAPDGLQRPMLPSDAMAGLQQQNSYSDFNTPAPVNLASPVTKRKHASVVDETTRHHQSKRPVTTSTGAHATSEWATPKLSSERYRQPAPVFNVQANNEARQTAPLFTEPSHIPLHQLQEVESNVLQHHTGSSTATASPLSSEDHLSSSFVSEDSASHQNTPATPTFSLDGMAAGKTSLQDQHEFIQPETAEYKAIHGETVISAADSCEPHLFIDFQDENGDEPFKWNLDDHEFSF
ncbi:hypothetical protein EJ03DRAFT_330036 [Teratosphaeria nubilosa]|uniref:Uncharacterized protein n=1 Tax=Teratosphaeria nubilosa TaxID=161662 RepID=A0A6G1L0X3_9PEZI|nr:hypothetical protein EJ03DRAFT_330036 [Teratosphaeria nubilosa]